MNFYNCLINQGKSINTINSYMLHISNFEKWFNDSYDSEITKLYRQNVLEYISYLQNIKQLNAKSINAKLSALMKYNEYLILENVQDSMVITKNDYIKVQSDYLSPNKISKVDVERFRQNVLEKSSKRDFALVTLLAYSGMRISEALNIKLDDLDLYSQEVLVRNGKGNKQRIVIINTKIVDSIKEYLKDRATMTHNDSEYLFISRQGKQLNRTVVNKLFSTYSNNKIHPHLLRHFFCSYALLEHDWSVYQVAQQVGHSNVTTTTMLYTHPNRNEIKKKANLL